MAARKQNAMEAKAAKQKKIAIGGAVLLVAVMVFQGPKMLKLMSGGGSTSSAAPVVAPTPVPGAVPTPPTPTPVSATTPSQSTGTKLISFERFSSKDPFTAQVTDTSAASTTKAAAGTTTTATKTGATTAGASPSSFKMAPTTKTGAGTVRITVNGKTETVANKADFPKADPTFTLAGIQSSSVTISIAGGALKTGSKMFLLNVGKPTTLLNTADGKRYTLKLVSTAPQAA